MMTAYNDFCFMPLLTMFYIRSELMMIMFHVMCFFLSLKCFISNLTGYLKNYYTFLHCLK